jgi:hypothetical protein
MSTDRQDDPFHVLRTENAYIKIYSNLTTKTKKATRYINSLVPPSSVRLCLGESKQFFTLFHATAAQNDYTLCTTVEEWIATK